MAKVIVGYSPMGGAIMGDAPATGASVSQSTDYNVPAGTSGAGAAAQVPAGSSYTFDPKSGQSQFQGTAVADAPSSLANAGYAADQQSLQLRAKLQGEAEARRLAALSSQFTQGSGTLQPRVGASAIPTDENAARAAAFGRAKDQAGQIARSALTGIQENVAGRGVAGGGIEALKTAGAIQDASAPLQDLTREQYINDLNRGATISDETYQGNIAQRGQDVSQSNANRASLMALISSAFGSGIY